MSQASTDQPISRTWIDHIPVIWTHPGLAGSQRTLVVWLPGLGGNKEQMEPRVREIAARGFVALSYDPWQHGERATEAPDELIPRVFGNFRRHMWPILAHTAEDALRVLDWAIAELGVEPKARMGGISMGGDVSVAAAGLDSRIERVAAGIATADWLRPGTNVPPGQADAYARLKYDACNPHTHLARYEHCPAITFECGALDDHVPPDGALRFRDALTRTYSASPDRLRVNLHQGVGHEFTDEMWSNCVQWLTCTG